MAERVRGKELIGKTIVSEEKGKKFGEVSDLNFITETGELMNLVLVDVTKQAEDIDLERDQKGRYIVPFSSVNSVGDFVIVSEDNIV